MTIKGTLAKGAGWIAKESIPSLLADETSRAIHGEGFGQTKAGKLFGALKSNMFGFGEVDELLTLDAFRIADEKEDVKLEELINVAEVIVECDIGQRKKIVRMLGQKESPLKKTKEKLGKDGKVTEKTIVEETPENVRGGRIVAMLAKMKKPQIRLFLKAVGADITAVDSAEALLLRLTGMEPHEVLDWTKRTLGPNGTLMTNMNARRKERLSKSWVRRALTRIL
ncbi:MAG: hypothetical protein ABH881_00415 [bacterium]